MQVSDCLLDQSARLRRQGILAKEGAVQRGDNLLLRQDVFALQGHGGVMLQTFDIAQRKLATAKVSAERYPCS